MDDILAKKNRHLFLEEKDNQNNSFIGNVNTLVNDLENVDTVADNITDVKLTGESIESVNTVAANIEDINNASTNIDTVKTFNDNVNNGTMQYLLEAFTTSLNEQGNAWEVRLTQLGESILATTSAFNYSTVVTVSSDIPANGTLILPNSMKYKVGTHMLMVSWNGTVCYAGEQYDEVGAYGVWATSIKLNQPAKTGDKIQLRIVALTDQSSYVDITEAAINASQFVASGSNTERYLPEFLGDVVNVKNFGAVGNGVNDDTTAFQSAIASGKAVFVPEGTYKLSTNINGMFCGVGNSTFTGGTVNGSTILRGTVKRNNDIINVEDFGAKGDGIADDFSAIAAAITAADAKSMEVVFNSGKTYKLSGSTDLTFKNGAKFNGCTIDISGFSGVVYLNSPGDGWIEDSSAKSLLSSGNDIPDQSAKIDAWVEYADISKHFIRIESDQYFYTYRGTDISRYEYNFVTDRGSLLSPIKYGMEASSITKVTKLALCNKTTTYSDVVFKVGSRQPAQYFWGLVQVLESSNVRLLNISFDIQPCVEYTSGLFGLFQINKSCHVLIDGLYFVSSTHDGYCIMLSDDYDVKIKNAIGQGAGWGATGNNSCRRIVFEECDLNRIDFHQPFFEYLKIKGCTIGYLGITTTAVGDLIIEDTKFLCDTSSLNESPGLGIIKSRGELGGLCDGVVHIQNCTVVNNMQDMCLFYCTSDTDDLLKEGSPLEQVFWRVITVDSLRILGSKTLNISPRIVGNKAPLKISYSNVEGNCRWYNSFTEGIAFYGDTGTKTGCEVVLNNFSHLINFYSICNLSGVADTRRSIVFNNVKNINTKGTNFVLRGHFDVVIRDSDIASIIEMECKSIKIRDSRIDTSSATYPFVFTGIICDVSIFGCTFVGQPTKAMFTGSVTNPVDSSGTITGKIGHIRFHGNSISSQIGLIGVIELDTVSTPESPHSFSLPSGIDNILGKNVYIISLGLSGEYYEVACRIPNTVFENIYHLNSSYSVDVSRSGPNSPVVITSAPGVPVRRVSVLI